MSPRFDIREPAAAFTVGAVFGAGLIVSGMADPGKVKGFLDLAGAWDPSLALVMGAAVAVGFVGFRLAGRRARSWLGLPMRLPRADAIDRRLLVGGAVFGVGWGLAGFCPGPAIVALASGMPGAWIFAAAMIAGMGLYEIAPAADATRKQDGHAGKA